MRIVAGELRGRRIQFPSETEPGMRPTSERARTGLFDWIGPRIEGERVLDLFAGSGALGIEALSRGSSEAVFVESARTAVRSLRRNLRDLDLVERSDVLAQDVLRALPRLVRDARRLGGFGFVFADPPYEGEWSGRLANCPKLVELLAPGGALIFERSKRETAGGLVAAGLKPVGAKLYGETAFDWYQSEPGPKEPERKEPEPKEPEEGEASE